jgi:cellulose synthase (UDP-forming)
VAGAGAYTWRAFALAFASWWIHVHASIQVLRRRPGRFVVTPKRGSGGIQLRAVWPSLAAASVLVAVIAWGLSQDRSPGTLNNAAFASVHVAVLVTGVRPALRRRPVAASAAPQEEGVAA